MMLFLFLRETKALSCQSLTLVCDVLVTRMFPPPFFFSGGGCSMETLEEREEDEVAREASLKGTLNAIIIFLSCYRR